MKCCLVHCVSCCILLLPLFMFLERGERAKRERERRGNHSWHLPVKVYVCSFWRNRYTEKGPGVKTDTPKKGNRSRPDAKKHFSLFLSSLLFSTRKHQLPQQQEREVAFAVFNRLPFVFTFDPSNREKRKEKLTDKMHLFQLHLSRCNWSFNFDFVHFILFSLSMLNLFLFILF